MSEKLEVCGVSGQAYVYSHLPDGALPPFQGANLVVAERRRGRWQVLEISHTDYLPRNDWRGVLERVRRDVPRAQLFYRLNISHAVRQAEVADLRSIRQAFDESAIAA